MRRRELLGIAGSGVLGGLAGCTGPGLSETRSVSVSPLVENRPNAVYYPTHVEGMKTAGQQKSGVYGCALTYTYPHRFWLVTSDRRNKVEIEENDSIHLMPIVWERETGIAPPDVIPKMTITQNGERVTQLTPWPMLSQPMGFHFGDNIQLVGNGIYQIDVALDNPSTRRTGSLAGNDRSTSFTFDFEFSHSQLEEITYRDIPMNKQGTRDAVPPMEMSMISYSRVPAKNALPGTVRGTATSADSEFVVTTLNNATRFGGDESETYVAVSPRTPYNRYMLPLMSLSGILKRNGTLLFDGILRPTVDPDLHYHYGASVSGVQSGDELTVVIDTPPQIARHEGYETAFFEMADITIPL